ncbi:MAG: PTS system nitrogen regulatory IIA component [Paraglaciecola psychrophila]|jgi:PTS system nitrogen regulatory IIA component
MALIPLHTFLNPARTLNGVPGNSKKRVLENIAQVICDDIPSLNPLELFDKLLSRERLGSTGLGQGIAIPHCRVHNCTHTIGTLVKLNHPVDFDAIDGEKVDLLFVLLVPEQAQDEHLQVLATLAEKFSNPDYCQKLRDTGDSDSLYNIATEA